MSTPIAEPTLLNCPFCGGEARHAAPWNNMFLAECSKCLASTNLAPTPDEAAELWNKRTRKP